MSESVTLKSYFYEVLIPSSQKNTSSPIEDILHHVSISFMKKLALYKCFNPRTHTGCDTTIRRPPRWRYCFNPRTHTGCDVFSDEYLLAFIKFQSTHPHGVRPDFVEVHVLWKSFNPRTHTGCDVTNPTSSPFKSEFQSTHPHGVRRPRFPCSIGIRASFNPRTHTGCDSLTSIL